MTTTEDRIDKLFGQILKESISRDEIDPELRAHFMLSTILIIERRFKARLITRRSMQARVSLRSMASLKKCERFCFTT